MLRRKFLRNLSFLSITPFVGWTKLFKWFKPTSPLPTTTKTIFADSYDGSIWLRLLDPRGLSLPEMTVREFTCMLYGYEDGEVSDYFLEYECLVTLDELDDIVPRWRVEEYWYQYKDMISDYLGGLFIRVRSHGQREKKLAISSGRSGGQSGVCGQIFQRACAGLCVSCALCQPVVQHSEKGTA